MISIRMSRARLDQGFDDRGGIPFSIKSIDEDLVDLDEIDAELEHVGQAAVTGADIVDPDAHAEPLQCRDDAPCDVEIVERLALGDFEQDLARRNR